MSSDNMFTSFWDDLADSFHPVATGDFGSFFSVLGVAKERQGVTDLFDAHHKDSLAGVGEAEAPRASERHIAEEKRSLALIELLQKAIERREMALYKLRDEVGVPASTAVGGGTAISRLALEAKTDEALANEELGDVIIDGARVDMTDLLPPEACQVDPGVLAELLDDDEDTIASEGATSQGEHEMLHEASPPLAPEVKDMRRQVTFRFQSTSLETPRAEDATALSRREERESDPPLKSDVPDTTSEGSTGSFRTVTPAEQAAPTGVSGAPADTYEPSDGSTESLDDRALGGAPGQDTESVGGGEEVTESYEDAHDTESYHEALSRAPAPASFETASSTPLGGTGIAPIEGAGVGLPRGGSYV